MPTINELKEMETPGTPLFLFDCILPSGDTLRWSTHAVTLAGVAYPARVLSHNLFEMKSSADEAADGGSKVAITLANADSFFARVAWKGARRTDRKSTRLNSSHQIISYAVFCLKKKKIQQKQS